MWEGYSSLFSDQVVLGVSFMTHILSSYGYFGISNVYETV